MSALQKGAGAVRGAVRLLGGAGGDGGSASARRYDPLLEFAAGVDPEAGTAAQPAAVAGAGAGAGAGVGSSVRGSRLTQMLQQQQAAAAAAAAAGGGSQRVLVKDEPVAAGASDPAALNAAGAKVLEALRGNGLDVVRVRPLRRTKASEDKDKNSAQAWRRAYGVYANYETLLRCAEKLKLRKRLKRAQGDTLDRPARTAIFKVARLVDFEHAEDSLRFFSSGERLLLLETLVLKDPTVENALGGLLFAPPASSGGGKAAAAAAPLPALATQPKRHAKIISDLIPLHEPREADILSRRWLMRPLSFQPLELIANYFGHATGFYFAFLGLYTQWLLAPAAAGLALYLHRRTLDEEAAFTSPWNLLFGLSISLWTTLFLEYWKREQSELAFTWDSLGYDGGEEEDRPEFREAARPEYNADADDIEWVFPWWRRAGALTLSFLGCLGISLLATGTIIYLLALAGTAQREWTGPGWEGPWEHAAKVPTAVYLASLSVFSSANAGIARWLTELEGHRTESQHRNAVVVKLVLMQFCVYFVSPLYIAFAEQDLRKLHSSVFAVLGLYNVINQLAEVGVPLTRALTGAAAVVRAQGPTGSEWAGLESAGRTDIALSEPEDLFSDYLELWVQFGQVALFSMVFPLAPLLALANNVLEIRLDAFKMLRTCRRALPVRASGIGSWLGIFEAVGYVAVMTNVGLAGVMLLQSGAADKLLPGWSPQRRVLLLVAAEHAIVGVKLFVAAVVPDLPEKIDFLIRTRARHEEQRLGHEFELRMYCQDLLRAERKQYAFRSPPDQARHLLVGVAAAAPNDTLPQNLVMQWVLDQEERRARSERAARYYKSLAERSESLSNSRFSDLATAANLSVVLVAAVMLFTTESRQAQ